MNNLTLEYSVSDFFHDAFRTPIDDHIWNYVYFSVKDPVWDFIWHSVNEPVQDIVWDAVYVFICDKLNQKYDS
jgi:hypothetical protein